MWHLISFIKHASYFLKSNTVSYVIYTPDIRLREIVFFLRQDLCYIAQAGFELLRVLSVASQVLGLSQAKEILYFYLLNFFYNVSVHFHHSLTRFLMLLRFLWPVPGGYKPYVIE